MLHVWYILYLWYCTRARIYADNPNVINMHANKQINEANECRNNSKHNIYAIRVRMFFQRIAFSISIIFSAAWACIVKMNIIIWTLTYIPVIYSCGKSIKWYFYLVRLESGRFGFLEVKMERLFLINRTEYSRGWIWYLCCRIQNHGTQMKLRQ